MEEKKYEYHVVLSKPTETEIADKKKDGWELCDAPEGPIGTDPDKEPVYPHSKFYFRRETVSS